MAARSDAAAAPGPKNGVLMSVSLVSSSSKPEEKQQKRTRLLLLPAQGSAASGVRGNANAASTEAYELG